LKLSGILAVPRSQIDTREIKEQDNNIVYIMKRVNIQIREEINIASFPTKFTGIPTGET